MTRVSLCLNMIVKDEAAIIEGCLESVAPYLAAYAICDTGSSDGTQEVIRACMDRYGVPGELHEVEFRNFEYARNRALDLARALAYPYDYLLLTDADMTLVVDDPGFRDRLDAPAYLVRQETTLSYYNTRLVRREVPSRYVGLTHEHLHLDVPRVRLDTIWFRDRATGSSRGEKLSRDIRLLTEALTQEPDNPRTIFYLAQSLKDAGRLEEAIQRYRRRVDLGGWDEEVWYALYMIARCYERLGDEANFIKHALEAYHVRPSRAEPLYHLARHYREAGKNEAALLFAEAGAVIPFPESDLLFIEREVYTTGFTHEKSIAGYYSASPARRQAGRDACFALLTDRFADSRTRQTASRNAIFYATSAAELFGAVPAQRLNLAIEPPFTAMNPSIAIDGDEITCLLRTVNYRIGQDGRYELDNPAGVIRTRNYLATLDPTFTIVRALPIVDLAPEPPVHPFPVQGFEDCRLFRYLGRLRLSCTVRDRNAAGRCELAVLELDTAGNVTAVHVQRVIHPERHQKNWVPLVRDGELFFIYASDPLLVLRFDSSSGKVTPFKQEAVPMALDRLRGGSQALRVADGWLYVVHEVADHSDGTRSYLHRFVLIDDIFAFRAVTPPFYFQRKGIEFCAGLARDERTGRLVVSYGVADREAWLGFLDESAVRSVLEQGK